MNDQRTLVDAEVATLVEELLARGRAVRLRVSGGSMTPWLADGDVVTLRRVEPRSLVPGDILLARSPGDGAILHRLVARRRGDGTAAGYLLKGDALGSCEGPFPPGAVAGKVVAIERESGGRRREIDLETTARRVAGRLLAWASAGAPRLFARASRLLSRRTRIAGARPA
jgi:hypothetical protein